MAHAEDELRRELRASSPQGRQWVVSWHKSIPTTMEAAKELVPLVDHNHPGLCVAEIQSSGRGTRGRTWIGVEEGFYGTFVFDAPEDRISAEKLPAFSLVVGLIVAEVLTEIGCQARVKWVNDVLSANGKKISGNLLELVRVDGRQVVLTGVGVNLRGSPDPDMATSVYDLLGRSVSRVTMASWLANRLADSFAEFLEHGFALFMERWSSLAAYLGEPISVLVGEERVIGVLAGVDVEGRLRLQLPSGERIIHTGPSNPTMILVIDIGNTNIVFGLFEGDALRAEFRLKTDMARTPDEYESFLMPLISRRFPSAAPIEGVIISSVVPPVTPEIVRFVTGCFSREPILVGPGIKTGVAVKTSDPAAVGADRVVNAAAVKAMYGTPALVIDFGTATTFDYVNAHGDYEGGIIAPGPTLALDALVRNTAKLPRIELQVPKHVIGKNTVSAMQSGVVLGYLCMVEGLIDRVISEVGQIPHVIATGGLGKLFSENSKKIQAYEAHLTLHGLRLMYKLNADQRRE